jgi:antirestriction protein ArdC
MSKSKKSTQEIYQEVTDKIIASLEEGNSPWKRPWKIEGGSVHRNMITKKPYRGVNQWLLDIHCHINGYRHSQWLTFKQAGDLSFQQWCRDNKQKATKGGKPNQEAWKAYQADEKGYKGVRKGEKGTMVVFFKMIPTGEMKTSKRTGKQVEVLMPLLRHFTVFNIEQTGLKPPARPAEEFTPIERAQAIIDQMPNRPDTEYGYDKAGYAPGDDVVYMPDPTSFDSPEHRYATEYHELVHATGHGDRLNRITDVNEFGSDPYAKEELVAEMGSAMLCGLADISVPAVEENAKAYCRNWISQFEDNPRLIVQAASKAQGAADYIIGQRWDNE